MIHAILGKKLDQTQMFTEDGERIPVTKIQAGPCWITYIIQRDAYKAVQLGFDTAKHMNKAQVGHLKKAGLKNKLRFFHEVRVDDVSDDLVPGKEIKVHDVLKKNDHVSVTGTSKGKGFAGTVKRYGFGGGPRTHGQSDRERAPGSIGAGTTPGRVYKGKKMAGRMGGEQVKQRGLRVMDVDEEKGIVTIKGLVPGPKSGLVLIEVNKRVESTKTE